MQLVHLMCTIQWFLVCLQSCVTITAIHSSKFWSPHKEASDLLSVTLHFSQLPLSVLCSHQSTVHLCRRTCSFCIFPISWFSDSKIHIHQTLAQESRQITDPERGKVGKIPWRRTWQPTSVFMPGESPRTEEPGGPQSMGLQRVGHDWVTQHSTLHILIRIYVYNMHRIHKCYVLRVWSAQKCKYYSISGWKMACS